MEKLFRRYDKDGSGDIDFQEFLKLIVYSEALEPEVSGVGGMTKKEVIATSTFAATTVVVVPL